MGATSKNYQEQGGARLVIGGELAIEEGARVTGLPSNPDSAFYVIDLEGVDLSGLLGAPVEITGLFPPDCFLAASQGYKPILFRNAVFAGRRYSAITITACEEHYIAGLLASPSIPSGAIQGFLSLVIFPDEEDSTKIMLRANLND